MKFKKIELWLGTKQIEGYFINVEDCNKLLELLTQLQDCDNLKSDDKYSDKDKDKKDE